MKDEQCGGRPCVRRTRIKVAEWKAETLPLFAQWGFWHNDAVLKRNAVRPIGWILRHCPELWIRALLGTGLDAEVVELVTTAPRTVADVVRATGASYAAAHAAAMRLRGRGLLSRQADKAWTVSPEATGVVRAVRHRASGTRCARRNANASGGGV